MLVPPPWDACFQWRMLPAINRQACPLPAAGFTAELVLRLPAEEARAALAPTARLPSVLPTAGCRLSWGADAAPAEDAGAAAGGGQHGGRGLQPAGEQQAQHCAPRPSHLRVLLTQVGAR